jgi:predicted AAA+ superfamily ATPase
MIIRKQLITLQERMQEPRQFIQVLAGTRQVGKTTLVKQLMENWMQIELTRISC